MAKSFFLKADSFQSLLFNSSEFFLMTFCFFSCLASYSSLFFELFLSFFFLLIGDSLQLSFEFESGFLKTNCF